MRSIISILLIVLLSLFTFFPSFNLALFGDDWLAFYRYSKILGPFAQDNSSTHLKYFLTPYGAQDILMGLLQKIYGYQSSLYYLTSYIFRIIAAVSFYPLTLYLTKSKLAAFFAILFFSITAIGIDTTNWVFNMPSYITIALFNLFLYFFLKSREDKKPKLLLIISGLLYYLAYVITPIRMHGSLLLIFLLETFWFFQKRDKKTLKKIILRLTIIILIFLIIRYTGHSQGPPEEISQRLNIGITTDLTMLKYGRFDFIFYPIVMFGAMFLPDLRSFLLGPDQLLGYSIPTFSYVNLIFIYLTPAFLGFLLLNFVLMKNISLSSNFFWRNGIAGLLWIIITLLIHQFNATIFFDEKYILSLTLGGFAIIIILSLILKFFKEINITTSLFLSFSWSILAFFFAWWWVPNTIFPTPYRYFIVSAVGISIFLATIIGLGKNIKQRINIFSFLLILVIIHVISTHSYLSQLKDIRSQELYNRVWSQMPYVPAVGKTSRPIIFYFEGDGTVANANILYSVIAFGFPPHMYLLYNLTSDAQIPAIMDTWDEVISAVKDGKSFKRHIGTAIDPIPIDNVFAYHLEGADRLINITDLAREKLRQTLNN
ncbi:MAG: hypothetical protein G01um10147_37 [Microgenomates group bacterium Gr01-1014_7]|nr:MAG: hypothetical protein G01um10147_37 [Microgenomates group bacterium Gr01-1014_7]